MKRIFLFLVTNIAVVVTLSVVASVLGINQYLTAQGIDFGALLMFAAVFGFGGAFISLAISKWSAKMAVGAQTIEVPRNSAEYWLVDTVKRQAQAAGIGMPEVAIYESPEVNAFATGMSRNNALVAVSTGLLERMTREEAEAVLGHEVSHVANGDMVTLTLIQGVLNTFVIFLSRAIGYFVDRVVLKNQEGPGLGYYLTHIVLEILFGILASIVVMWFSRQREFRADAGGARLAGRSKMIAALQRLQSIQEESHLPEKVAAFGIKGRAGWMALFSTHPPLEQRIEALRAAG
ncbi:protease HtpX [Sulfurisoma sediminicola]|uniref:Protease HtpX homolog n=1 Tax=Sulfurisoma sediminicola TaxID=1381557 RepID=A0A497XLS0_9PROT|nr:protease HtpX [Sulfurisoma sediminicola]RLJ68206.1 heat shock protein [Sulfurisoma sediminicola]